MTAASMDPARFEYAELCYAACAIERSEKLIPGELSARAEGDVRDLHPVVVPVMACHCYVVIVALRPAGCLVAFSLICRSGVPCLPAFRFPTPQNGADITPFPFIVLHCFAECAFNPFRRIVVGSVFQLIC